MNEEFAGWLATGKKRVYAYSALPARARILERHQEGVDEGNLQRIACKKTVLRCSLFNHS
jgi:hypothetical protein